jgi:hypothetical protein
MVFIEDVANGSRPEHDLPGDIMVPAENSDETMSVAISKRGRLNDLMVV